MAQRFAWQALEKGFEVLTEHRANPEADILFHEALVVKDLRNPGLLLGVGEQELETTSTSTSNAIDAWLRTEQA